MSLDTNPPVINSQIDTPDFKSTIPEYLLDGAAPSTLYLMNHLSIISQKQDWQTTKIAEQAATLKEIKIQVLKTNGRVTALEKINGDNYNTINTGKIINKLFGNKYALVALICIFILSVHVISAIPIGAVGKFLISTFLGKI